MKNKGLISLTVYLLIMFTFGFGFGWMVYEEKYNRLQFVNNTLYRVIEDYEKSYDELETKMINEINSCNSLVESCQNANKDCIVNGGWNCE